MNPIIAAIMLAAASLPGAQPTSDPSTAPLNEITQILQGGTYSVAIGYCAGQFIKNEKGVILFGAYTNNIPGVDGFVNIGNTWCGLRSTGERVDCPLPVTPEQCRTTSQFQFSP